jgi:hypothetical protein
MDRCSVNCAGWCRCGELVGWGTEEWGRDNLAAGYMYCCTVEEAGKAIKVGRSSTHAGR